jgi:hypothetical protein
LNVLGLSLWLSSIALALGVLLSVAVISIWRGIQHRKQTRAKVEKELSGQVKVAVDKANEASDQVSRMQGVIKSVEHMDRRLAKVEHDVGAVGHEVGKLEEELGTDIIQSEERLKEAMDKAFAKILEGQGQMRDALSARPCIMREAEAVAEAREIPCPDMGDDDGG